MDRFTAALRRSTRQKFAHIARTALYYSDPAAANPKVVTVIVSDKSSTYGEVPGNMNGVEIDYVSPTIEFLREQVEPARNGFVSVDRGVVYQLDSAMPVDDLTISFRAIRVKAGKVRNFPYPSEALVNEVATNPDAIVNQPAVLPNWMKEEW